MTHHGGLNVAFPEPLRFCLTAIGLNRVPIGFDTRCLHKKLSALFDIVLLEQAVLTVSNTDEIVVLDSVVVR